MSTLAGRVAQEERDEIARAVRVLLAAPFLAAEHDEVTFDIIRRRHQQLFDWFERHCGWRLHVDVRQRYARLVKVSDRLDPTRPARRRRSTKAPFDRRRYALVSVIAAELLRVPTTTIGILAGRITEATAAEAEVPTFDPARREERAAYVDALKFLEHHRVIRAVDGITESFMDSAEVKVLYRVDTSRLLQLLASPVPPSRVSEREVTALTQEQRYGEAHRPDADVAEAQRNLWLRHTIARRLLDEPVVYNDELTAEQRKYLASPTGRKLVRQMAEDAGFVLEERSEGRLLVDPEAVATDERFPEERNHVKQAALWVVDQLAATPDRSITTGELVNHISARMAHMPNWARTYQSEGGAARMTAEAIDVLCAFRLAVRTTGGVRRRPAAARYTLTSEKDPAETSTA